MAEDAFDRAVRRERELRERLSGGELDDDAAAALIDMVDHPEEDFRLTVEQAHRLVDEGADPSAVAAIVEHFPRVTVDKAIGLVVDYGLEPSCVHDLVRAGVPRDVDTRTMIKIWEEEITPELLVALREMDFDDPVDVALQLVDEVDDPADLLRRLVGAGFGDLTFEQMRTIADNELNPKVLRRLLDCGPDLSVAAAIRLLVGGDESCDDDFEGRSHGVGINVPWGGRRLVVAAGDHVLDEDTTVVGVVFGDLRVLGGATVTVEATIFGHLHIEPGATVRLRGRVIGRVHNRGTMFAREATQPV